MSDPGQTTDVMWFPDVPRRFSQNFPRRLYAGLQSLEHLPHAPIASVQYLSITISFNMFKGFQRQRSQKSHSLNFGTQFLQVQNYVNSEILPSSSKLPHLLHRPSTHSSQLWVLHGATSEICQRSFPVLQEVERC